MCCVFCVVVFAVLVPCSVYVGYRKAFDMIVLKIYTERKRGQLVRICHDGRCGKRVVLNV